ncbi:MULTISPECIES: hypothetical protein [Microbacterium]|uniref:hypothetical protein n=1 Tax=Microbacterium TaxID=33882 RepID=UPI0011EB03B4|nr:MULTISPECIES: hypothetical protein [Microbacterium]
MDDSDYRLPEPVREGIARDATNNETELGATLASTYTDQARMGIVLPTEMTFEGIQAACDSAEALGTRVLAAGEITTDQTLQIKCNCDLSGLTINYTGTGTAVRAGTQTGYVIHKDMRLPVVRNANKVGKGWASVAGSIGVDLVNIYTAQVFVPRVTGFEVGLREYGMNGNGISYVTVMVGHLADNKINQKLDADSTGWANQITHIGGRWSHSSGEGPNAAGTRHILLVNLTGNADPNNNVWLNPSLESPAVVEYTIDVDGGSYNQWINPRFEFTSGQSKIRWGSAAVRNFIFGGNQIDNIAETWETGAVSNSFIGTNKYRFFGSGNNGGTIFESESSSTHPAWSILRTGGTAAGDDPATAYTQRSESNIHKLKRFNDAADRVRIDGSAGQVLVGNGTATPVAGLSGAGGALFTTAGTTSFGPPVTNTIDSGTPTGRWRYVRAATAVVTGVFTTASRPSAATVGVGGSIYDSDLTIPLYSDGSAWRDATGALR